MGSGRSQRLECARDALDGAACGDNQMQRDDAKPVARPQGANRRTRTLAEWCALRKYQYTVITGSGECGPPASIPDFRSARILQVHVHA